MIKTSSVSLDEEAALYREAFFHRMDGNSPLLIVKPKVPVRSRSHNSFLSRVVCYRCGQIGHMSTSCTRPLPRLSALEASMEDGLKKVLEEKRGDATLKEDEFGLYSTALQSPVSTKLNWETSRFCCNCGKAGHGYRKCNHLSITELMAKMQDALTARSRIPSSEVREFFFDLWDS